MEKMGWMFACRGSLFMCLFCLVQKEKRGQKERDEPKQAASSYHSFHKKFGGENKNMKNNKQPAPIIALAFLFNPDTTIEPVRELQIFCFHFRIWMRLCEPLDCILELLFGATKRYGYCSARQC